MRVAGHALRVFPTFVLSPHHSVLSLPPFVSPELVEGRIPTSTIFLLTFTPRARLYALCPLPFFPLPNSKLCPLSSVFCLLSSDLCLLSSACHGVARRAKTGPPTPDTYNHLLNPMITTPAIIKIAPAIFCAGCFSLSQWIPKKAENRILTFLTATT